MGIFKHHLILWRILKSGNGLDSIAENPNEWLIALLQESKDDSSAAEILY